MMTSIHWADEMSALLQEAVTLPSQPDAYGGFQLATDAAHLRYSQIRDRLHALGGSLAWAPPFPPSAVITRTPKDDVRQGLVDTARAVSDPSPMWRLNELIDGIYNPDMIQEVLAFLARVPRE